MRAMPENEIPPAKPVDLYLETDTRLGLRGGPESDWGKSKNLNCSQTGGIMHNRCIISK